MNTAKCQAAMIDKDKNFVCPLSLCRRKLFSNNVYVYLTLTILGRVESSDRTMYADVGRSMELCIMYVSASALSTHHHHHHYLLNFPKNFHFQTLALHRSSSKVHTYGNCKLMHDSHTLLSPFLLYTTDSENFHCSATQTQCHWKSLVWWTMEQSRTSNYNMRIWRIHHTLPSSCESFILIFL